MKLALAPGLTCSKPTRSVDPHMVAREGVSTVHHRDTDVVVVRSKFDDYIDIEVPLAPNGPHIVHLSVETDGWEAYANKRCVWLRHDGDHAPPENGWMTLHVRYATEDVPHEAEVLTMVIVDEDMLLEESRAYCDAYNELCSDLTVGRGIELLTIVRNVFWGELERWMRVNAPKKRR